MKEQEIKKIILKALDTAKRASEKKIAELVKQGPKYRISTSKIEIKSGKIIETSEPINEYLLDDCGYAWISGIKGSSKFGKVFIELTKEQPIFFWASTKHAGITSSFRQELSVNVAGTQAFCDYIKKYLGIELEVVPYLD